MTNDNELNRREFLARSAAVATAASLPVASFAQETMRERRIPGTNESLPVVGLGAPDIFINMPEEGSALPKAALQAMLDHGGRVLDTAPFFRPNPPIVGDIIAEMGVQDELFLTGKITVRGKEAGIAHLEKTVANLNKKPIDCLMVHNMRELDVHWPTLKDWKEQGRCRYIGVSLTRNQDYVDLEKFMQDEKPDIIMTGYSVFHPLAAETALPMAADLGIAAMIAEPFKAFDDGGIFGHVAGREVPEWAAEIGCETWAQFALKYILSTPAVTCVVTETSKVKHVIDNMQAGFGDLPDLATQQRMRAHILSM